ncbi:hypothetical protein QPM05_17895 [Caldibacillus thermoamylovorans]|nr:hypothetical protein [Caldibacillus thermoamylovorans]
MTTKPELVTVLKRKMLYFGDEPCSRHRFEVKNALLWRRDPNSSPF